MTIDLLLLQPSIVGFLSREISSRIRNLSLTFGEEKKLQSNSSLSPKARLPYVLMFLILLSSMLIVRKLYEEKKEMERRHKEEIRRRIFEEGERMRIAEEEMEERWKKREKDYKEDEYFASVMEELLNRTPNPNRAW